MRHLEASDPKRPTALVASSNPEFLRNFASRLELYKWDAEVAKGGADALAKAEDAEFQLLCLDRRLADLEVSEVAQLLRQRRPHSEVVVLEYEGDNLKVLEALSSPGGVSLGLFQTLNNSALTRIPGGFPSDLASRRSAEPVSPIVQDPLPGMVGRSEAIQQVYKHVRLVANHDSTVLITGETGTGKELVASAVQRLSARSGKPFVVVNCAAIPESLLESELFGYARGAFTGAFQSRMGRIHAAHEGTLLLDEIGDLPLGMQAKLLRFLEEGEVQRLGGSDVFKVDVRVIASTNSDLIRAVAEGNFREDLYYRLAVFPVEIPPLRDRLEDVLPLAQHFLEKQAAKASSPTKSISSEATGILVGHNWPGNVRELQHVIERAFILSDTDPAIQPEHISLRTHRERAQRSLPFAA